MSMEKKLLLFDMICPKLSVIYHMGNTKNICSKKLIYDIGWLVGFIEDLILVIHYQGWSNYLRMCVFMATHTVPYFGFFGSTFYYLPPDNDVLCCHLVSPPGNAELCAMSAPYLVCSLLPLRVNAAVLTHHTGGSCEEGQIHCSVSINSHL